MDGRSLDGRAVDRALTLRDVRPVSFGRIGGECVPCNTAPANSAGQPRQLVMYPLRQTSQMAYALKATRAERALVPATASNINLSRHDVVERGKGTKDVFPMLGLDRNHLSTNLTCVEFSEAANEFAARRQAEQHGAGTAQAQMDTAVAAVHSHTLRFIQELQRLGIAENGVAVDRTPQAVSKPTAKKRWRSRDGADASIGGILPPMRHAWSIVYSPGDGYDADASGLFLESDGSWWAFNPYLTTGLNTRSVTPSLSRYSGGRGYPWRVSPHWSEDVAGTLDALTRFYGSVLDDHRSGRVGLVRFETSKRAI